MDNPAPPSALSPEEMPGSSATLTVTLVPYEDTRPLEEPSSAATLTIALEPYEATRLLAEPSPAAALTVTLDRNPGTVEAGLPSRKVERGQGPGEAQRRWDNV